MYIDPQIGTQIGSSHQIAAVSYLFCEYILSLFCFRLDFIKMSDEDEQNKNDDVHMTTDKHKPGTSTEISATTLNLRLSPFWNDNPTMWFIATEVQFTIHKVTKDDLKFSHTILALPQEIFATVADVIQSPPTTNRYETLKAVLIERNSPSEEKRLETLLDKTEMGDKRPSEVLRQIKSLAGDKFNADMIKSLWIRKMPEFIRIALVAQQDDKTSDELARIADKLNEAMTTTNSISTVQHTSRATQRLQPSTSRSTMEERVTRIEKTLAQLTNRSRSSSQNRRFTSRPRFRSNSRSRQGREQTSNCWYHKKFGAQAQKCTKPCSYQNGSMTMNTETNSPNQ